jgi:hypothetical protein
MKTKKLSAREIDTIRIEVEELGQTFERLKEKTKSMPGYRNRIEDGLARIRRIEKYLRIEPQLSA